MRNRDVDQDVRRAANGESELGGDDREVGDLDLLAAVAVVASVVGVGAEVVQLVIEGNDRRIGRLAGDHGDEERRAHAVTMPSECGGFVEGLQRGSALARELANLADRAAERDLVKAILTALRASRHHHPVGPGIPLRERLGRLEAQAPSEGARLE